MTISSEEANLFLGIEVPTEAVGKHPSFPGSRSSQFANEDFAQDPFQVRRASEQEVRRPQDSTMYPLGMTLDVVGTQLSLDQSEVSLILSRLPHPSAYLKPYRSTQTARDFIRKQKRPIALDASLDQVSSRIAEFMNRKAMKSEVIVDLEIDPEYDDWVEPRIKVLVEPSKLGEAYTLFEDLLGFALRDIRKRESKRFMITLDSM